MKKFIAAILLSSLFTTNVVRAQETTGVVLPKIETPTGEVDPGEALSPMKSGQKAPFSGVLLSPKAVASIIARLASIGESVKLAESEATARAEEVCRTEKSTMQIRTKADDTILRARIEDNERNLKRYETQIKEMRDSSIDPGLLVGIGAAGGIILTTLSVLAVSYSNR